MSQNEFTAASKGSSDLGLAARCVIQIERGTQHLNDPVQICHAKSVCEQLMSISSVSSLKFVS